MELVLTRMYNCEGTIGTLTFNGHFVCFAIELPWRDNIRNTSCIPEGSYELKPRFSTRFDNHLHLQYVKDRSLILIHPANNARKELQGCIAPVMQLSGPGKGLYSRVAMEKLLVLFHEHHQLGEKIVLTITSHSVEYQPQIPVVYVNRRKSKMRFSPKNQ